MEDLLAEQAAYYRARAAEYDEWFYRRGRYDHGPELNARWLAEAEEVRLALESARLAGHVLELAPGTGIWTQHLLEHAAQVTAVDASPEMLALNRARVGDARVRRIQADIFRWRPDRSYDGVFFGFWLSHVPPDRFEAFWRMVAMAVKPGGRVFFVDSGYDPTSTAIDHRLEDRDSVTMTRRLNDGREFRIVKAWYQPAQLAARLRGLGWTVDVRSTASYFIYGSGALTKPPSARSSRAGSGKRA